MKKIEQWGFSDPASGMYLPCLHSFYTLTKQKTCLLCGYTLLYNMRTGKYDKEVDPVTIAGVNTTCFINK